MTPIDKHFKKHLDELEIKPSAALWQQKIAPNLGQKQGKVVPPYWRMAAAILLLPTAAWFTVQFFGHNTTAAPELPITVKQPSPAEVLPREEEDEEILVLAPKQRAIPTPIIKNVRKSFPVQNLAVQESESAPQFVKAELHEPELKIATVDVKVAINAQRYLPPFVEASENSLETPAEESIGVVAFLRRNWQKSTLGQKIETTTKDLLDLPQVAVRIEGNPIKGVLRNKIEE